MVKLKTKEELLIMQEAGHRLKIVMKKLLPIIDVGVTTNQIDQEATRLIKEEGGEPGFAKVKGYKWATCLPINEQAVHTPPSDRILKDGDLLTIDIGLYLDGFHTDHAVSMIVGGQKKPEVEKFLSVGREALGVAIKEAKVGNYVGDISAVIEKKIYGAGYFILKQLTGHGIGRQLHEDPIVPGFVDRPRDKTYPIQKGLALAIEIIYSMGSEQIEYESGDNWSIKTRDGSLSACVEHTVVIMDREPIIIT